MLNSGISCYYHHNYTQQWKGQLEKQRMGNRKWDGNRYRSGMETGTVQEWDGNWYRNGKPEWEQHIAKWALFWVHKFYCKASIFSLSHQTEASIMDGTATEIFIIKVLCQHCQTWVNLDITIIPTIMNTLHRSCMHIVTTMANASAAISIPFSIPVPHFHSCPVSHSLLFQLPQ